MEKKHWLIVVVFMSLIATWIAIDALWITPFYFNMIDRMPDWLVKLLIQL